MQALGPLKCWSDPNALPANVGFKVDLRVASRSITHVGGIFFLHYDDSGEIGAGRAG